MVFLKNSFFAEGFPGPRQRNFLFFKKTFAEGLIPGPRQSNFQEFFKKSLPRATARALGKDSATQKKNYNKQLAQHIYNV
jgi:hypothetical protein